MRLVGRAVSERWPIPRERRAELIAWLVAVARDSPNPRRRVAAVRVLVMMDAANLADLEQEGL